MALGEEGMRPSQYSMAVWPPTLCVDVGVVMDPPSAARPVVTVEESHRPRSHAISIGDESDVAAAAGDSVTARRRTTRCLPAAGQEAGYTAATGMLGQDSLAVEVEARREGVVFMGEANDNRKARDAERGGGSGRGGMKRDMSKWWKQRKRKGLTRIA